MMRLSESFAVCSGVTDSWRCFMLPSRNFEHCDINHFVVVTVVVALWPQVMFKTCRTHHQAGGSVGSNQVKTKLIKDFDILGAVR